MIFTLFIRVLSQILAALNSINLPGSDLFNFGTFGQLSWNRPPPPPPIFFSTTVDFTTTTTTTTTTFSSSTPTFVLSENFTSSTPSSPFFDQADSSSPPVSIVHQGHARIFAQLVQMWTWVFAVAMAILVAILQALVLIAPPATVAYTLRQQRRQDLANLELGGVASLDDFWDQINQVTDLDWIVAALRDDLAKITRKAELQRQERDAFVQTLHLEHDDFVQTLRKGQDAEIQTLQMEQDAEVHALRQGQDLYVLTLQLGQDDLVQTLREEQNAEVQTLQLGQEAVEQTLLEVRQKCATNENTIDELKLAVAEAHQRLTEAKEGADQRILDLEQTLDAERVSAREKKDELKAARELIASLQSTMAGNSQELSMFRDRARAQHQLAYGQRQTQPPPPPPPMPMPFPPPAPFLPRPMGMPPNRTSGFMGSTPPPPPSSSQPPMPMPGPFPPGPPAPVVPRPMPPNRTSGFLGSAPPPGWGQ